MATDSDPAAITDSDVTPDPDKRAYMVWSRRLDQYVRKVLTDAQWRAYDLRGSID